MARNIRNKAALVTVKILFFINQLMALAPIRYNRATREFCTHRVATIGSLIIYVALAASSPFVVRSSVTLYTVADVKFDSMFDYIVLATLAGDVALTILLLGLQLHYRHQLVKVLNALMGLYRRLQTYTTDIVYTHTLLLVWLKFALNLYDFVGYLPYLYMHAREIGYANMTVFFITLCVQQVAAMFGLDMLGGILLINAFVRRLEVLVEQAKSKQRFDEKLVEDLISIECALKRVVQLFMGTFEIAIFFGLIHNILNLLENLYALLEVFVLVNQFETNLMFYCLMIFINLYSLIFASQLCTDSAQCANWAFLDLEAEMLENEDDMFERVPPQTLARLYQVVPLQMDFSVLGLFSLKNDFILFIVAYSVNFFVIILEFEINKYVGK